MKRIIYLLLIFVTSIVLSCSPKVATIVDKGYSPLVKTSKVLVLKETDQMPSNTESLGIVKISDSGVSTKCGYTTVIEKAKEEARKIGGNIIKITDHIKPNFFGSSCHQITALMLKTDDLNNISFEKKNEEPLEAPITTNQEFNNLGNKFKIIVHGGYSYRIAKIDEDMSPLIKDYIKGIKSGFHIGADIIYFYSENRGVGLQYSLLKTSNRLSDITLTYEDGTSAYGNLEDNISLSYIGTSYTSQLFFGANNNVFSYGVGLGYLGFNNEGEDVGTMFKRQGATLGTNYTAGLEVPYTTNLSLSVKAGILFGLLNKSTITYVDGSTSIDDRKENLNRIDISLGLVCNL